MTFAFKVQFVVNCLLLFSVRVLEEKMVNQEKLGHRFVFNNNNI